MSDRKEATNAFVKAILNVVLVLLTFVLYHHFGFIGVLISFAVGFAAHVALITLGKVIDIFSSALAVFIVGCSEALKPPARPH